MQQTISEKSLLLKIIFNDNLLDTLIVSCIWYTVKVKIPNISDNSQVTKAYNSLVDTSEAIRLLTIYKIINRKLSNNGLNSN
jgi:hypothetical protein